MTRATLGAQWVNRQGTHVANFVHLDLVNDPHARAVMKAYADRVEAEAPGLANMIRLRLEATNIYGVNE